MGGDFIGCIDLLTLSLSLILFLASEDVTHVIIGKSINKINSHHSEQKPHTHTLALVLFLSREHTHRQGSKGSSLVELILGLN